MGKRRNAAHRSILLPALADAEFAEAGKLAFWKRVLPEGASIDYRDKDGQRRRIDFTEASNRELLTNFANMDQTPFMLADADNRHTMDPERYRGEVTALVRHTELPADAAAALADESGAVAPGLYSRIEFGSKKMAKAVLRNPRLGVSARIREAADGGRAKLIHVLGTLDPKVRGLGAWAPAADFSEYAHDELVDLTHSHYSEAPVGKKSGTKKPGKTIDLSGVPDIADVTVEDIDKMTDAQVEAFMARYGPGGTEPVLAEAEPEDKSDAKLSHAAARRDVDLANAAAEEARRDGREALKRAAAIEWKATRKELLHDGVPPSVLDLAEPVLKRPYDLVVDLSNTDDDDVNVAKIVRSLVDGYKGTIDFTETGHDGPGGADPDATVKERFARDFPDE